ncbi:metallophosphoesterase [Herbaspirillum sp. AP02]|uniref:metallophosphoesterase n=1 Tax=unclassified Herbaspirillum TaxID=2624150 RepID=UPI0015DA29C5|nr:MULTISPECIES: metallophosphoesterase [unclassified Herbaspirillum]MBG7621335.1 metallophosphoesterase [Herbaspirillum sp. AP02]NZD66884.1 metallophosphoesterase [Herbaspirillum sp. AP21]
MRRSLTSVFVILGLLAALHAWIGWQLLPALSIHPGWIGLGAAVLVLSFLLMPVALAAPYLKRRGLSETWSDRLAWAGMLAMGAFSSALLLTLLRTIALALLPWLAASLSPLQRQEMVELTAWLVLALTASATVIGYLNARRTAAVVEVNVPIANLPPALEGFTIVQISDIHVGPTIKAPYLQAIVDKVNALQPDVVAITGDLVDGSVRQLAPHTAPLAQLRARHGAYFVTGNHEYYSNAHEWIDEVRRLGVTVLMNEHVVLRHEDAGLVLAGVTDYTAHHFDPAHRSDPQAAIADAPAHHPRILLAHQPRSATAAAAAGYDLQLSGHTHGGQFFPWNLFVPLQQPYVAGLKRLQGLWIYVSRGTGYWGPPKRLLAPSEITRVRLTAR